MYMFRSQEIDHMKLSEAPSPQGRSLGSPSETELSKIADVPQSMFQVKEEPLEEAEELAAGDEMNRIRVQREDRRMLMA